MPPKCLVDKDTVILLLTNEKYRDYFNGNEIPKYSHNVWKELHNDCNAWKPHNWYVNICEDRRKILTEARAKMLLPPLDKSLNDTTLCDPDEASYSSDDNISESEIENCTTFDLHLDKNQWDEIKPGQTTKQNSYCTLKPGVWTNVIADAFFNQFRLPCSYLFKQANIFTSCNSPYYLVIKGRCSSKKCLNPFKGLLHFEPTLPKQP